MHNGPTTVSLYLWSFWASVVMTDFLKCFLMGQLLHCNAMVLSQNPKNTLKNLRISALGNHKWFFNYQRKKLKTVYRFIGSI